MCFNTKVQAPAPRDLANEAKEINAVNQASVPEQYNLEKEFGPAYAGLQRQIAADNLFGAVDAPAFIESLRGTAMEGHIPGLTDGYQNALREGGAAEAQRWLGDAVTAVVDDPGLAAALRDAPRTGDGVLGMGLKATDMIGQANSAANTAQRTADLNDQANLGGQQKDLLKQFNPELYSQMALFDSLSRTPESGGAASDAMRAELGLGPSGGGVTSLALNQPGGLVTGLNDLANRAAYQPQAGVYQPQASGQVGPPQPRQDNSAVGSTTGGPSAPVFPGSPQPSQGGGYGYAPAAGQPSSPAPASPTVSNAFGADRNRVTLGQVGNVGQVGQFKQLTEFGPSAILSEAQSGTLSRLKSGGQLTGRELKDIQQANLTMANRSGRAYDNRTNSAINLTMDRESRAKYNEALGNAMGVEGATLNQQGQVLQAQAANQGAAIQRAGLNTTIAQGNQRTGLANQELALGQATANRSADAQRMQALMAQQAFELQQRQSNMGNLQQSIGNRQATFFDPAQGVLGRPAVNQNTFSGATAQGQYSQSPNSALQPFTQYASGLFGQNFGEANANARQDSQSSSDLLGGLIGMGGTIGGAFIGKP